MRRRRLSFEDDREDNSSVSSRRPGQSTASLQLSLVSQSSQPYSQYYVPYVPPPAPSELYHTSSNVGSSSHRNTTLPSSLKTSAISKSGAATYGYSRVQSFPQSPTHPHQHGWYLPSQVMLLGDYSAPSHNIASNFAPTHYIHQIHRYNSAPPMCGLHHSTMLNPGQSTSESSFYGPTITNDDGLRAKQAGPVPFMSSSMHQSSDRYTSRLAQTMTLPERLNTHFTYPEHLPLESSFTNYPTNHCDTELEMAIIMSMEEHNKSQAATNLANLEALRSGILRSLEDGAANQNSPQSIR